MEDFEENYEDACPKCGHSPIRYRDCLNLCEDGWFDESEENYCLPGTDMIPCNDCRGTGMETWCPACGANLSGYEFPDSQPHFEDPNQLNLFKK